MIQPNLLTKTLQLISTLTLATGLILIILLGAGLIPLPHFFPPPMARAAGTINVTTTGDEYGSGSGCSLREAIESVNTNSSFGGCNNPANAADTIQLQAMTYNLSIPETSWPDSNAKGSLNPKKRGVDIT